MSNSWPIAPCAVSTRTASGRAGSDAECPGPCSPASSDSRNAVDALSRAARPLGDEVGEASRRCRARVARRPIARARSTSRREHGQVLPEPRKASCTDISANSAAFARASRADRTVSASSRVRPSVRSSASADRPRPGAARPRTRPRAAAGDSPTTSEVSSGSTSPSRARGVGDEPSKRQDVGARGGLGRERQAALGHRRGIRASSSARSRPPDVRALAPDDDRHRRPRRRPPRRGGAGARARWRRVPPRRAARPRPRRVGGASAPVVDAQLTVIAAGKIVANRSSGAPVVPWNENTCASGSAADHEVGGPRARSGSPPPRAWCPGSRRRGRGRTAASPSAAATAARCSSAAEVHEVQRRPARSGTRPRNRRARASPSGPRRRPPRRSISGVRSASCARTRNCRTSSANPRSRAAGRRRATPRGPRWRAARAPWRTGRRRSGSRAARRSRARRDARAGPGSRGRGPS